MSSDRKRRRRPELDSTREEALQGKSPLRLGLRAIYDREQMTAVVQREVARADRNGDCFSLAIFNLESGLSVRAMVRLARLCVTTARVTDEVGVFDLRAVCILLPDTPPDGAKELCAKVVDGATKWGLTVKPMVYAYPTSLYGGGLPTPAERDANDDNQGGDTRRAVS